MKISVVRSGGFAGLITSWVIVIPKDDEVWRNLVRDLPWDEVGVVAPNPDRYVYHIRVSRRQITLPEQQIDGAWRTLVERVIESAEEDGSPGR